MKTVISTSAAPAAIGPYSQAISAEGLIFVSGQLPIDAETGAMPPDIASQAHQSLKNLKAILESAGSSLKCVVKTTVFLNSIADFTEVNGIYSQYFTESFPARSCFEVSKLPKGALIEIEAIAVKE